MAKRKSRARRLAALSAAFCLVLPPIPAVEAAAQVVEAPFGSRALSLPLVVAAALPGWGVPLLPLISPGAALPVVPAAPLLGTPLSPSAPITLRPTAEALFPTPAAGGDRALRDAAFWAMTFDGSSVSGPDPEGFDPSPGRWGGAFGPRGAMPPGGRLPLPEGSLGRPAPPPARRGPAPKLEDLKGTLRLADLRVPPGVSLRRKAYRLIHGAAMTGAAALILLGTGLPGLAAASGAWIGRAFLRRAPAHLGIMALDSNLPEGEREALGSRTRSIVARLVRRLGLPTGAAPEVGVANVLFQEHGKNYYDDDNAFAFGGLNPSGGIGVGDAFKSRTDEDLAGVMGHELTHLLFNDRGPSDGPRWLGASMRRARRSILAAVIASVGLAVYQDASVLGWTEVLRQGFPGGYVLQMLPGILTAALALPLALAAFLARLAGWRQEELRADHGGAWMTRPEWLIGYFSEKEWLERGQRGPGLWQRLTSTHPALGMRIRRLESMKRPDPAGR